MKSIYAHLIDRSSRIFVVLGLLASLLGAPAITSTVSAAPLAQATDTLTPSETPTLGMPTDTLMSSDTPTSGPTTETPTNTVPTVTATATLTPTASATATPSQTPTPSATLTPSEMPTPTPTVSAEEAETMEIDPAGGGKLISKQGWFEIEFPGGAVDKETQITFKHLPPPTVITDTLWVPSQRFEMEAEESNGQKPIKHFKKPAKIKLRLEQLGYRPGQIDGRLIWFGYYNEDDGVWERIPFTLDQTDESATLQASVDHFTTFGVGPEANPGWRLTFNEPQVGLTTGAATFGYPLQLPPGQNGLAPSLNLSYNNQQVDHRRGWDQSEWVGHGWSLDTVAIARRMGINTTDSTADCTGDFTLIFNDTGYALIAADPNAKVGRYYTQPDSTLYIERINGATNEIGQYWIVKDARGTLYRLGARNDSEQITRSNCTDTVESENGYAAFRWRADWVTDVNGNQMLLTYTEERRQTCNPTQDEVQGDRSNYLDHIYYNAQTLGGQDWKMQVDFNLALRPSAVAQDDGANSCGKLLFQSKYLDNVTTKVNGLAARKYQFQYQLFTEGERTSNVLLGTGAGSREIIGITEYGYDANGANPVALPQTTFSYVPFDNTDVKCVPSVNCGPGPGAEGPNSAQTWFCGWNAGAGTWENPLDCTHFVYWRLSEVQNGYGARTTFTYGNDNRSTYWLGGWTYRVIRKTIDPGMSGNGSVAVWDYSYMGPCYSQWWITGGVGTGGEICQAPAPAYIPGGNGISAHAQVVVTAKDYNGTVLSITAHSFKTTQNAAKLVGREYQTEWRDPAGTLLRSQEQEYSVVPSGTNRWAVHLDSQTERTYDSAGGAKVHRTTSAYDSYSNLITTYDYGAEEPVMNPGFEESGADTGRGSDFETSTNLPWVFYWSSAASVVSGNAHTGTYSLQLAGGSNGGAYWDITGLTPGATYVTTAWVKASASSMTSKFNLWLHDTAGANTVSATAATPSTTWTQLSLTYIANATGKVRLHLNYTAGSGAIFVDDVTLTKPTWTFTGSPTPASVVTTTVMAGNASLRLQGGTAGDAYQDIVGLTPNTIYTVRAWVTATVGATVKFNLSVDDTTGGNTMSTTAAVPPAAWTLVTLNYTANATGKARLHLVYTPNTGVGTIYVDEVAFARASDVGDERTTHQTYLNVGDGAPQQPLLNPGFESGSTSWLYFWNPTPASVVAGNAYAGQSSLQLSGGTTGGAYQDVNGLTPGNKYLVHAWVKATAGATGQFRLWLHDTTSANNTYSATLTPSTAWLPVSAIYTANSTGKVRIHLFYTTVGSGTIYVDAVTLERMWLIGLPTGQSAYAGLVSDWSLTPKTQSFSYYDGYTGNPTQQDGTLLTKGRVTQVGSGLWNHAPDPYVTTQSTYDAWGNVISQTDAEGNTTTTLYDSVYHLYPVQVTNPLTQSIFTNYDFRLGVPLVITTSVPPGGTPANGVATSYTYDNFGRLLKVIKPGDSDASPTLRYEYRNPPYPWLGVPNADFEANSTWEEWDPSSLQTFSYDTSQAHTGAQSLKIVSTGTGDFWLGNKAITNWQANRTYWVSAWFKTTSSGSLALRVYAGNPGDAGGTTYIPATGAWQLIQVAVTLPSTTNLVWIYFRSTGTVFLDDVQVESVPLEIGAYAKEDAAGNTRWTRQVYDGMGRLIQEQTEKNGNQAVVVDKQYDARGLVVKETSPAEKTSTATGSNYIWPTWTEPQTFTQYDALGRTVVMTATDGTLVKSAYSGWKTGVLDPNGHQHVSEADAFGQVGMVKEYTNTLAAVDFNLTPYATTKYGYDSLGHLTTLTDTLTNTTVITYNVLGQKIGMLDPDMGAWAYGYDANGNLIRQDDAKHQRSCLYYDDLNRLKGRLYTTDTTPCSTNPTYAVSYTYDTGSNGIGHRTMMTDTSGTASWAYDARGRVISESKTITGAGTYVTSYTYDPMDRVTTLTYPTGEVITQTYNTASQLASVTGLTPYASGLTYNVFGQIKQMTLGNGAVTSYDYYGDGGPVVNSHRLWRIQTVKAGSPTLLNLQYGYDNMGNVKTITDTVNANQIQSFTYDALDRLLFGSTTLTGTGQYNETYAYNPIGNITAKAGVNYAYSDTAHKHAVTHLGGVQDYWYDANGNMTKRIESGVTYTQTFDAENRLITVTSSISGTTSFFYDGDGNRVKKVDASSGQTTIYVGALFEKNLTTNVATSYYLANGKSIALRQNSTVSYLHGDHLGSTSLTTDSTGNVVSRQMYLPYGQVRYVTGTLPTDKGFTGQRLDATGLMFYNARYYSATIGRFISADMIVPGASNPQALNRFSYNFNSPIVYVDPSGHDPILIALLLLAAIDMTAC